MAITVAQKLGSVAIPLLYEKYRERGAVQGDVAAIQKTIQKCVVLLQNLPPAQHQQVRPRKSPIPTLLQQTLAKALSQSNWLALFEVQPVTLSIGSLPLAEPR